jgi:asparagine synthase (glutamine-hydrolysing)
MCGINGILAFRNHAARVREDLLVRMRDAQAHRGPDGEGLWVSSDARIGLAHRRLAIIDLSPAAAQPMSNENGSLRVVFNGEIYNHAEIRAELEQLGGHRWKTDHSDTEVILHAFEQWGIACLERFRGMFAIALWDAHRRELWLVRDRIGVKPLYYSVHHGRLNFASEIKALLEDPEQKRAVHEEALFHYLTFLTTPAPQTLFDGIQKLPAGTWLRATEDGQIETRRYWDVWDHATPLTGIREEEIAARLLAELRTAVKLRKVSDVPVGVFLSGGIDSSVNAALFSEDEPLPVKTFSIAYDGECASYPSELSYARRMAARVGAEHHERILTQADWFDFLPRMIYLQDEPIADPVCMPVYYVSELARKHGVIVCQVGEGSDELFCGYPFWKLMVRLQQYDNLPVPRGLKRAGLAALRAARKEHSLYYELLRRGAHGVPIFWSGAEALSQTQKDRLLSPRLRKQFIGQTSWGALAPLRRRFEEKAWDPAPLHWMTYVDLNLRLPELLLMRVDKMSMGVSLEGRVPFLDHKFVELAMSIPASLKLKGGVLKYILKKAVRGLIPDELIDRKKQGFGVPIREWFSGRLGHVAREELAGFCEQTDYFDAGEVQQFIERGRQPTLVWYLLNLTLWWKQYVAAEEPVQRFEAAATP